MKPPIRRFGEVLPSSWNPVFDADVRRFASARTRTQPRLCSGSSGVNEGRTRLRLRCAFWLENFRVHSIHQLAD